MLRACSPRPRGHADTLGALGVLALLWGALGGTASQAPFTFFRYLYPSLDETPWSFLAAPPGCNSISVADESSGEALFDWRRLVSWGRLRQLLVGHPVLALDAATGVASYVGFCTFGLMGCPGTFGRHSLATLQELWSWPLRGLPGLPGAALAALVGLWIELAKQHGTEGLDRRAEETAERLGVPFPLVELERRPELLLAYAGTLDLISAALRPALQEVGLREPAAACAAEAFARRRPFSGQGEGLGQVPERGGGLASQEAAVASALATALQAARELCGELTTWDVLRAGSAELLAGAVGALGYDEGAVVLDFRAHGSPIWTSWTYDAGVRLPAFQHFALEGGEAELHLLAASLVRARPRRPAASQVPLARVSLQRAERARAGEIFADACRASGLSRHDCELDSALLVDARGRTLSGLDDASAEWPVEVELPRGEEVLLELLHYVDSGADSCQLIQLDADAPEWRSKCLTSPKVDLVDWKCVFEEGAPATAHTLSSFGMSAVTACSLPAAAARAAARTGAARLWLVSGVPGWTLGPIRLGWGVAGSEVGTAGEARPYRLAMCGRPLFDAAGGLKEEPAALVDWLEYHLHLGVEHFTLMDKDGSFAELLAPYVEEGLVEYWGRWPERVSGKLRRLTTQGSAASSPLGYADFLAHEWCAWRYRGRAAWVILGHGLDKFPELPESPVLRGVVPEAAGGQQRGRGGGGGASATAPEPGLLARFLAGLGAKLRGSVASAEVFAAPLQRERGLGRTPFAQYAVRGNATDRPFMQVLQPEQVAQTGSHLVQPRLGKATLQIPPEVLIIWRLEALLGEPQVRAFAAPGPAPPGGSGGLGAAAASAAPLAWAELLLPAWRARGRAERALQAAAAAGRGGAAAGAAGASAAGAEAEALAREREAALWRSAGH